jgi:hypothetical protein
MRLSSAIRNMGAVMVMGLDISRQSAPTAGDYVSPERQETSAQAVPDSALAQTKQDVRFDRLSPRPLASTGATQPIRTPSVDRRGIKSPAGAAAASVITAGHGFAPTLDEVRSCFLEARAYYKNQVKSHNKVYYASSGDSPKTRLRHDNAKMAQRWVTSRRSTANNKSAVEYGGELFEKNIKDGACGEMSSIVANLINKRFPNSVLHQVTTGDHTFIVVGERPQAGSIEHWENHHFSSDSYAVDVWMNICCKTQEYAEHAKGKLNKWTSDGKSILTSAPPGKGSFAFEIEETMTRHWYNDNIPNSKNYAGMILRSPLTIASAK